jgi:hypothetical protein
MAFNRSKLPANLQDPAMRYFNIVPDDADEQPNIARSLYIGTGGDLRIAGTDGMDVVLKAVPTGYLHVGIAVRVYATGTTAEDIVGFI